MAATGKCPVQHPQLADAALPGWPRPRREWKDIENSAEHAPGGARGHMPDLLPVPWMNGPCVERSGDWHSFRREYAQAHYQRLCVICGEANGDRIILGNYASAPSPSTSGPGGHPRCMWLAVNTCPHLVEQHDAVVAWEYTGPGPGYHVDDPEPGDVLELGGGETVDPTSAPLTVDTLRTLAHEDPLGTAADVVIPAA